MSYISNRDPDLLQAVNVIENEYSVEVSVEEKAKNLLKFGRSEDVQTTLTTLMTNQSGIYNETYVRRNLITHFASGSTADVQDIIVEGHTVGADISVSTLTQAAGLATCTTATDHGFATDEWVYIEGANETEYNGIIQVTVTGLDTFTYSVDAAAASPATGTITATSQNKTFLSQRVTLFGQTKTALTTPMARVSRGIVPPQDRCADLIAPVYIAEDVTFTSGQPTGIATHLIIPAASNNTLKAATSLSNQDYWIITAMHTHIYTKANSFADVRLEIREEGGVFSEIDNVSVGSSSSTAVLRFRPYIIAPKNSDIRLRAIADVNGRDVGGSIEGYLAIVT